MATPQHNELRLYAHRGASAHVPENSLEAFQRALNDGATALELDIHRTADGHFVVAHDPHGRRLAGRNEAISDLCLEDVKKWDLSTTDVREVGPHAVPTLEEVLSAFPDVPFSVDHKPDNPGAVPDLLELLARYGAEDRVTLASFSTRVIGRIRSLGYRGRTALSRPEIVCLRFLPAALARKYVRGDAAQIPTHSGPIRLDTTRFLQKCRTLGIRTDFWVVNDPARARELLAAGATGIMTDDPAVIAPVFREKRSNV
jgi:glycerophosphoryl diester phosphodiesterase